MGRLYELSGAGWYGEIWLLRSGKWEWAVAMDLTEKLACGGSTDYFTYEGAERALRAFVKLKQEQDVDRWLAFASRVGQHKVK